MQVQRIQNNNTTFGIKADKKQCQKVLKDLEPEIKESLCKGISRFCDITQKHGVKGTFYPIEIKTVQRDVVLEYKDVILEYKIIDLHNNGGNRIFRRYPSVQEGHKSFSRQKNNFTIQGQAVLGKNIKSKFYLDDFLSTVRKALREQQQSKK